MYLLCLLCRAMLWQMVNQVPEVAAAAKEAALQEQYGDDPTAALLASTTHSSSGSSSSSSGGHGKASKAGGSAPAVDPLVYQSKLSEAVAGVVGGVLGGFEGEVERRKKAVAEVLRERAIAAAERLAAQGMKVASNGSEVEGGSGRQGKEEAAGGGGGVAKDEALERLAWQHFDLVRQMQLLGVEGSSTYRAGSD